MKIVGFHQCKRFRELGFSFCPLGNFEEHEDDDDQPTPDDDAVLPPPSVAEAEVGLATPALVDALVPLAKASPVEVQVRKLMEGASFIPMGKLLDVTGGSSIGEGVVDAVATAFVPQEILDIVRDPREDRRGEQPGGFSREVEGAQEGPGLLEAARAAAVVAGVTTLTHTFVRRAGGKPGGVVEKAVTKQIEKIIKQAPTKGAANPGVKGPGQLTGVRGGPIGVGGRHKNVSQQFVPDSQDIFGDFMIGVGDQIFQRGAG